MPIKISDIDENRDWSLPTDILKGVRVLVIEDEDPTAMLIREVLENHECFVDISKNVDDAKQKLENSRVPFDCMILDIILKNEKGFEVLDFVREKSIPIKCILSSAYSDSPEFHFTISKSGISDKVQKPLSNKELMVTLCTTISVGRFVCDKHNDSSMLLLEDRAIASIGQIKRAIRAEIAITAMDPDEKDFKKKIDALIRNLEILERAQNEIGMHGRAFSARYFVKGIRGLFGGVSNTTITEATKFAFQKLIS